MISLIAVQGNFTLNFAEAESISISNQEALVVEKVLGAARVRKSAQYAPARKRFSLVLYVNQSQLTALKTALANFKNRSWEPTVYISINNVLEQGTYYISRLRVTFVDTSPTLSLVSIELFGLNL